jgi:UDP-2-acetamido-3-amino-2,3-dideoxy-glucuronate N-acetyltransferase
VTPVDRGGEPAYVHPTAIVEEGVELGPGTSVWSHVHVRAPARIGRDCILGEKSYVAYGVEIGDRVKVNAFVYVCTGVTLEDGVMVSAGTIFTNDPTPRATTPDLGRLRTSEPDEDTLSTVVRVGASLGAGALVGPGVEIGRFSMVGMGSLVTHSVPDFHLVVGRPARPVGVVCRCGRRLLRLDADTPPELPLECARCGGLLFWKNGEVSEQRVGESGT